MNFTLKPVSLEAIPSALAKAERYRLLNEPREAESICLDALAIEPRNQEALRMLLLALTDQFEHEETPVVLEHAWQAVARMEDDYDRAYYSGIVLERRAKAHLHGSPHAYEWLREAMNWFEKAEALRPRGNDDAILRWNTCARLIMRDLG